MSHPVPSRASAELSAVQTQVIYNSADLSDGQVLKTPFGELKNLISERGEGKKRKSSRKPELPLRPLGWSHVCSIQNIEPQAPGS